MQKELWDEVLREQREEIILFLVWAVVGRGNEGIENYFKDKEAFLLSFEGPLKFDQQREEKGMQAIQAKAEVQAKEWQEKTENSLGINVR